MQIPGAGRHCLEPAEITGLTLGFKQKNYLKNTTMKFNQFFLPVLMFTAVYF
jgi:hypothetical protein